MTVSLSTTNGVSLAKIEAQNSTQTGWMGRSVRKLIPAGDDSGTFQKILSTIICTTITTGFLIGGGITYGVKDHQCTVTPADCDDTGRYTAYIIMWVGVGLTSAVCCLACLIGVSSTNK